MACGADAASGPVALSVYESQATGFHLASIHLSLGQHKGSVCKVSSK